MEDSNKSKSKIRTVCSDCGIEANRLTCLKRHGAEPKKKAFSVSTFHKGKCDWCNKEKMITEVRDFFYPEFGLMGEQTVCRLCGKGNLPHLECSSIINKEDK